LPQIGFHGRLHVGILQLASQHRAVMGPRLVDLAKRRRGGWFVLKGLELPLPVGTELGRHSPLDKCPAHRRSIALQLGEFGGIIGWQQIRDGRHQLRHLHDRPFEAAQRRRKIRRSANTIVVKPEQPGRCNFGGDPTHIGAHPHIARRSGGKPVRFSVLGRQNRTSLSKQLGRHRSMYVSIG
jgi:hypothetical protein